MFLAKIECEKTTVEKIAEILLVTTNQFRIWLYDKKVYASFFVNSFALLRSLIKTLEAKKIKFMFYRIEEI